MKQVHIHYSGKVQGIGFRYTVQRLAVPLGLTGWIKNLADGRVEMMVEGPDDLIQTFCQQVDSRFEGYIKQKNEHLQDATGQFNEFQINF